MNVEDGRIVPGPFWDDVRDINYYLDSMAYFFLNADWQSAGRETDNLATLDGSFIDSVKSLATYDSAFIQVGFFEYNSENYAYVLNRRVDDGEYDHLDTQSVTIYMPGTGVHEVWDVYANTCDTVWASCDDHTVEWTYHFAPGEGLLLKTVVLQESWSGTPDTSWFGGTDTLWSGDICVFVDGDVTIDSGQTLTINTTGITVAQNRDTLKSGTDTTLIEFIVDEGELRIDGTSAGRIVLAPDSATIPTWYGIRIINGGHLFCDNTIIKHAEIGIHIEEGDVDTITYTRVEDCDDYGIWLENNKFFMNRDTIISDGETTTGFRVDASTDTSIFWSSLISGPDYGARFEDAHVDVEDVEFSTDIWRHSGSYYGLAVYGVSEIDLDGCEFLNYYNGIAIHDTADLFIDSCHFNSDVFGGDGVTPAMGTAIDGIGADASCKVIRSCFDLTDDNGVNCPSGGSFFDLGTYPDTAENEFWFSDTIIGSLKYKFPLFSVRNPFGNDTIYATCNYWDQGTRVSLGTVDRSSPMTWKQPYCHGATGEGSKLAEETTTDEKLPFVFSVSQNYPNPFNPKTVIAFTLSEAGQARIEIYNILAQKVITLMDRQLPAGHHSAEWNGVDAAGRPVSSGVYLYRFESGDRIVSRKMLLMK